MTDPLLVTWRPALPFDFVSIGLLSGLLLLVGLFAGILAGLLGVGGGIVIVPALFHLFGLLGIDPAVRMHLAVGTSLATIIPTSIVSMRSHARRGGVDWALLRSLAPSLVAGVVVGTVLAGLARGQVLTALFGAVALVVSVHMAFAPAGLRLASTLPTGPVKQVLGAGIGGFSSMMGIGGGTLTVPILVLCDYPIRQAVGTAAAVGLLIALPGTIGDMVSGWGHPALPPASLGFVNLLGFALITPATILTAPLGARLAHRIDTRMLRRAFALFLGITAARMLLLSLFG